MMPKKTHRAEGEPLAPHHQEGASELDAYRRRDRRRGRAARRRNEAPPNNANARGPDADSAATARHALQDLPSNALPPTANDGPLTPAAPPEDPSATANATAKQKKNKKDGRKRDHHDETDDAKKTPYTPKQNMRDGQFLVVIHKFLDAPSTRFEMLSLLGEGAFGKVVECLDRKHRRRPRPCAVKVVSNIREHTRNAKIEAEIMKALDRADPDDAIPVVKMIRRRFETADGHVCIAMPLYGPCLGQHLHDHGALPLRHIAEIIFQCAVALDFLSSEKMRIVLTDLKPDNILLESPDVIVDPSTGRRVPILPCRVRVADFGGCYNQRNPRGVVMTTAQYRPPEMIIKAEWDAAVPLWAMGCIIYELATGARLFDGATTDDGLEHLHMIQKVLGAPLPPDWGVRHSRKKEKALYFDDASTSGDLRPLTDAKSVGRVASTPSVAQAIQDDDLRDLIVGLLQVDPKRRLDPRQMAAHAFVRKHYPESESSQPLFFSKQQRAGDPSPPTAPQKEEPSH